MPKKIIETVYKQSTHVIFGKKIGANKKYAKNTQTNENIQD